MIALYSKWTIDWSMYFEYIVLLVLLFMSSSYRAVPLLPEFKEVMDWMFTPTALQLSHWLKVQEIWALLYDIKTKRQWEKVCVCVCVCTYMCVCARVCAYVCLCMFVSVCLHAYAHTCMWKYVSLHACMCVINVNCQSYIVKLFSCTP